MGFNTIKARRDATETLSNYTGDNPYILTLKRDVIVNGNVNRLTDFNTEYVLMNKGRHMEKVGKIVHIADWYGEVFQKEFFLNFTPKVLQILVLIGETSTRWHCYVKYRKSVDPIEVFIPKNGILENFMAHDYNTVEVDFDRYDQLSMAKDPDRFIMDHQKEAVKFLLDRKKCILADDMGLGKTLELTVASIEGNFDSVLIICPASVKTTWAGELQWYVPERDVTIIDNFNNMTKPELERFLGYSEGKSNMTVKELLDEAKSKGKWKDNRFVIVNYDIIDEFYQQPQNRSKAAIEESMKNSPILQYVSGKKSLVIIDEAHLLSGNKSIRYKVIEQIIKKGNPHSVYMATGTPITNNPKNLYYVLKLIGNHVTDDWKYYMKRYCGAFEIPAKGEKEKWTNIFLKFVKKNSWRELDGDEKVRCQEYIRKHARMITVDNKATNLNELYLRISDIYMRRVKEEILAKLPPKIIHELHYEFTPEQKAQYDKLWEEYEAEQLDMDPTKELNKDLLENAVYRRYCSNEMVPKTLQLADKLIENGDKVVVFCCYDEELYSIADYYGDRAVIYNGKMSTKAKDKSMERFKREDDVKVFVGNIESAGVGITLVNSSKLIFNNISFVPGDNNQAVDRVHRIGQRKPVDIYFQFFDGTYYEEMWTKVMRKSLAINAVIKTGNTEKEENNVQ